MVEVVKLILKLVIRCTLLSAGTILMFFNKPGEMLEPGRMAP